MVPPGDFRVAMYRYQDGALTQQGMTQELRCDPLNIASLPPADREALDEFNKKVAALARANRSAACAFSSGVIGLAIVYSIHV